MSGPIVRTGTTPEFWKGWDRAFGGKSASADSKTPSGAAKKAGKKAAKKSTKAVAGKAASKKKK